MSFSAPNIDFVISMNKITDMLDLKPFCLQYGVALITEENKFPFDPLYASTLKSA